MPKVSDIKLSEKIRALVYGNSKAGKTFGAGTFPRPNFISFDQDGINTLAGRDFKAKYPDRVVMYESFQETSRNPQGIVTAHRAFDSACRYFDECMKKSGKWRRADGSTEDVSSDMFDTWVIDSGTTLAEVSLNKAIVLLGGRDFSASSKTHSQALNTGLLFPKIQDWGSERSMTEQFIQMVLDTDKHVILLCHEKEVTNDDGKLTKITPLLTGKGVAAVCLKFDELWNLQATKHGTTLKRTLLTQTDGIRMAGSRYGITSGTEWNYDAIVKELNSSNPA